MRLRWASSTVIRSSQLDTILSSVENEMKRSIKVAFGDEMKDVDPLVFNAKASHGDYQSNIAMTLSKQLRMKPQEIAKQIVDKINHGDIIGSADISGPGFINIHLSHILLQRKLLAKLQDDSHRSGITRTTSPKKVVVDFSSPNIAKEMHVVSFRI